MDRTEVTNDQFAAFVKATGYVTVAERTPQPGDFPGAPPALLVAGALVFSRPTTRCRSTTNCSGGRT
jgi:formylglycine-generating enzyme required for sulfatase activity